MQWATDRLPGWAAARRAAPAAALAGAAMVAWSASAGWPANDRSGGPSLAPRTSDDVAPPASQADVCEACGMLRMMSSDEKMYAGERDPGAYP